MMYTLNEVHIGTDLSYPTASSDLQWRTFLASSSGSPLPAGPGHRGDPLRGHLSTVAVAADPALRPPAGDIGVLRPGRLLFICPTVHLPSDTGSDTKAQTSITMLWLQTKSDGGDPSPKKQQMETMNPIIVVELVSMGIKVKSQLKKSVSTFLLQYVFGPHCC